MRNYIKKGGHGGGGRNASAPDGIPGMSEDIGFVYQRVTAAEQLEAAHAAVRAERPEMEAVLRDYTHSALTPLADFWHF